MKTGLNVTVNWNYFALKIFVKMSGNLNGKIFAIENFFRQFVTTLITVKPLHFFRSYLLRFLTLQKILSQKNPVYSITEAVLQRPYYRGRTTEAVLGFLARCHQNMRRKLPTYYGELV